jgi:hypothetical protein
MFSTSRFIAWCDPSETRSVSRRAREASDLANRAGVQIDE